MAGRPRARKGTAELRRAVDRQPEADMHRPRLQRFLFATAALLVLVVAGFGLVFALGGPSSGADPLPDSATADSLALDLTATESDAVGVRTDTRFLLKSIAGLTAPQVRNALRVEPEVPLRVTRLGVGEFDVAPERELEPDTLYRIAFVHQDGRTLKSWAFQARAPLRVVSTIPAPQRVNVPLDAAIEITFSHDGVDRPEEYVEITPAVEGRFERHKRTLVFVPRALEPMTIYTVRLPAGVAVQGSDAALEDDYVLEFETGRDFRVLVPAPSLTLAGRLNSAAPGESPLILLLSASIREAEVEVFAYRGLDPFLADMQRLESLPAWAQQAPTRFSVDTSGLDPVLSFTAVVEGEEQSIFRPAPPVAPPGLPPPSISPIPTSTQPHFRLPQELPEGFYLIQVHGPQTQQAWLQVTDVAVFASVSRTTTLVWANDVATGDAIAGARVEVPGEGVVGTTGADGVAEFPTSQHTLLLQEQDWIGLQTSARGFLLVKDGSRTHVVALGRLFIMSRTGGRGDLFAHDSGGGGHWSFMVTDRPMYQPHDSVKFWGMALPRDGQPERKLTARLVTYGQRGKVSVGKPVNLTPGEAGVFEGEIKLDGLTPGGYTLEVHGEKGVVTSTWLNVETYVKPAYRLQVQPRQLGYVDGDVAEFEVSASFFEGTPMPNLDLRYSFSGQTPIEGTVSTDARGKAILRLPVRFSQYAYGTERKHLSLSPTTSEESQISTGASVIVFPASVGIQARGVQGEGEVTLSGEVFHIDAGKVTDRGLGFDPYYYPFGPTPGALPVYASGPARNQAVNIEVTEILYDPVLIGERYDFINKVVQPVYRYDIRYEPRAATVVHSDADGKFSFRLPTEVGRQYRVDMWTQDAQGRSVRQQTFVFGSAPLQPFFSADVALRLSDGVPFPTPLRLGETRSIEMVQGGVALPSGGKNRYLFYEGQRGHLEHFVQSSPVFGLTFSERHIPNVTVKAVYFNGSTYVDPPPWHHASKVFFRFNPDSRRLQIDVFAKAEEYGPGDNATVEVIVTDQEGKPVEADVLLAAVDEALFAAAGFRYEVDVLNQIYRQVPEGLMRTYASHQVPMPPPMAIPSTGNGGGDRTSFEDTALWRAVRTGADGKATVTFKLPDNLTSWRVTATGVTNDLKAGVGTGKVIVSRPFFVDASIEEEYLAGERASLRLRAFGKDLGENDAVKFSVTVPSLGLAVALEATGTAFEPVDLELPRLIAGEHDVRIEATSGGKRDVLVRKVRVVESRLLAPALRFYESLGSGQRIEGADAGMTTVTFMDGGRGQLFALLQSLRWGYGDRVDQAVGRLLATELLEQHFGVPLPRPELNPALYLQFEGQRPLGVSLLPFAGSDLALTARIAALAPDLFGRHALRTYLLTVADARTETPERTAIALYGLAALGEPVLTSIRSLAADPELGWRGELYLGLGLLEAGDESGARRALDELVDAYGDEQEPYVRLRVPGDRDDIIEATAMAAVLAAGTGDPRAGALMRYVEDNRPRDMLVTLERIAFAKKQLARMPAANVRFKVTVDGHTEDVKLERGRSRTLSLSPTELQGLRLEVLEGTLGAVSHFLAASSLPAPDAAAEIQLSRKYMVDGVEADSVGDSGLVEVVLSFVIPDTAPDGCYQLTDLLPSGLKAVTRPSRYAFQPGSSPRYRLIYPYLVDGQRVSFCVYKGGPATVSYFVRPSGKGEFIAEPALLQNQRARSLIAATPGQRFRVE
jgi:alpha-2-macroglobulin